MTPRAQVQHFRSAIDGRDVACVVCATDDGPTPKPLLVIVSPGALNLEASVQLVEHWADEAAALGEPIVILRPTGRGNGSVYQNYGEVDVFEAIEHVRQNQAIDGDRLYVTGLSMGGAATWYLASHYPDVFAGAAPFCGYCDYRLWEKPGGNTFHMHAWEEHSWQARSAALLVDNLRHTPVWITHGQWDRAVGGGVPVEHSRRMHQALTNAGFAHRYTEIPREGHGCHLEGHHRHVLQWLMAQRKVRAPRHVSLTTFGLRHHRAYWVAVEQMQRYGQRAAVEAHFEGDRRLHVKTTNVRALTLGPCPGMPPMALTIDGNGIANVDLSSTPRFQRGDDGQWSSGAHDSSGEKRHGCSGPIGDLFFDPVILVPGTIGSDEQTHFNRLVARDAVRYFASRNGGVHRGGIMGENNIDLPVIDDVKLTDEQRAQNNLLLYGTRRSNAVLDRFADRLPMEVGEGTIDIYGHAFTGECLAAIAVFAHPEHPQRYVAVHTGVRPDAICWGSHLDLMLLPDYLVYDAGQLIAWGFADSGWGA